MRGWIFQKYFPGASFLAVLAFLLCAQVCFGNTTSQAGDINQADQKQTLNANNKAVQSLPQTSENKASQGIIKGQCDIIKRYESLCDTQRPDECANPIDDTYNPDNRQTWWGYANLCIDPEMTSESLHNCMGTFLPELGRNNTLQECLSPSRDVQACIDFLGIQSSCHSRILYQVAEGPAMTVSVRQTPWVQASSAPREVCVYTPENDLILQVLSECGNVRDTQTATHNPLLACWDNGRLTLTSTQVVRYQRYVGARSPCDVLDQNACQRGYCERNGIK